MREDILVLDNEDLNIFDYDKLQDKNIQTLYD